MLFVCVCVCVCVFFVLFFLFFWQFRESLDIFHGIFPDTFFLPWISLLACLVESSYAETSV